MVTPVFHSGRTLPVRRKKQDFHHSNALFFALLAISYLVGKRYGAHFSAQRSFSQSLCTKTHPSYQAAFDARVDSLSKNRECIIKMFIFNSIIYFDR